MLQKKTYYCNDNKLQSLKLLITKTPLLHICDSWFVCYTPMALAHPLHPIDNRSRNKRRNLWLGRCVSSDDLCFRPETLGWYIFIYPYAFFIRVLVIGYIHRECRSVLVKLHLAAVYRTVWVSVRFLCWMPLVVFFGFANCVLLYDNITNSWIIVTIGIRFKQLYHWHSF